MPHPLVCHDWLIFVPWLISAHWHCTVFSFTYVTYLIHVGATHDSFDVPPSLVCHDSLVCVPWLILARWYYTVLSFTHLTYLIHTCAMTYTHDMSHAYVCHDGLICVPWLISVRWHFRSHHPRMPNRLRIWCAMCAMTYSYLYHDSFAVALLVSSLCDMPHSYVCRDVLICVPWLMCSGLAGVIFVWHASFIRIPWLTHMCTMTYFPWHYRCHHCVACHICAIAYSYVHHDPFAVASPLSSLYDMPHLYMSRDLLICVPWLICSGITGVIIPECQFICGPALHCR